MDLVAVTKNENYQKLASYVQAMWRNKEHRAPAFFTASSIWLSVAQMISGVVIVHYVAPKEMGVWASVSLALVYSMFLLTGIQNGLSRELPYYLGANNEDMAKRLAATTLFYTDIGCILCFLGGIIAVALLIWEKKRPESHLLRSGHFAVGDFSILPILFVFNISFKKFLSQTGVGSNVASRDNALISAAVVHVSLQRHAAAGAHRCRTDSLSDASGPSDCGSTVMEH